MTRVFIPAGTPVPPFFGPEEPHLDAYWLNTNEPVRPIIYPTPGQYVDDTARLLDQEEIPINGWFNPFDEPIRPVVYPVNEGQSLNDPVHLLDEEFTFLEWWLNTNEFVREVLRPIDLNQSIDDPYALTQPEFVPPDRWFQPWNEPIRPTLYPMNDGWFAIDSEHLLDSEFSTPDKWFQAWNEPIRPVRYPTPSKFVLGELPLADTQFVVTSSNNKIIIEKKIIYQAKAEPVFIETVEEITLDKWFGPFDEPIRPILYPVNEGQFIPDYARLLDQEFTFLEWFEPWDEPIRPTLYPVFEGQFVIDPVALTREEFTFLEWWMNSNEFIREIPRPIDLSQSIDDPFALTQGENITLDKWFRPWEEPIRPIRYPVNDGWLTIDPQHLLDGEFISLDKWFRPWDEPIRPIRYPINEGQFAIDPLHLLDAEFTYMAWNPQTLEPIRPIRYPVNDGWFVIDPSHLLDQEFPSIDKWMPVSPPFNFDIRYWLQDFSVLPLHEVITAEEIVTLDKWFQPWEIARRIIYPQNVGWFNIDPSHLLDAEFTFLEWFMAWGEPVRPTIFPTPGFLTPDETLPEQITIDKWFRPWDEPFPYIRYATPGLFTENELLPEIVTLDKWFRSWDEPIRPTRYPVNSGWFVIDPRHLLEQEFPSLDKWSPILPINPVRLPKPLRDWYFLPLQEMEELTTLDKWFQPWSEPIRTVQYPQRVLFIIDPRSLLEPENPTLDKWSAVYPLFNPDLVRPTPDWYWLPLLEVAPPEEITLDKWFQPWLEPYPFIRYPVWEGFIVGTGLLIIGVTPAIVIEECVELEDLIDPQIWPNNVDPSGYINPAEEIDPSGFIKNPDGKNLWDF